MILATGGKMIIKDSRVIHCYKHVIPSRFIVAKPHASTMPNEHRAKTIHFTALLLGGVKISTFYIF